MNTDVNVDHDLPAAEIRPSAMQTRSLSAVALVIGLEPADKVPPSRLVTFEDCSSAKFEDD